MTTSALDRPRLSVIIVSYNTCEMTLDCLRILMTEPAAKGAEVFVVDNASRDGSAEAVRASFPDVRLIESGRNAGFGAANNLALRVSRGRYIMLLNTDAFPKPGAIAKLLTFLDQEPTAGVVGPRLLNQDGSLQQSCFRLTTPVRAWLENLWLSRIFSRFRFLDDYRGWDHSTDRDVDFVVGACFVIRREAYEEAGEFDERFFMYQEEADWQKRIKEAGWRIVFTPGAEVTHFGGASGRDQPARISHHFFYSLDIYMLKHHGWWGALHVRVAMLVGCSLRAIAWGLAALVPAKRKYGREKARLHLWLVRRQLCTPLSPIVSR